MAIISPSPSVPILYSFRRCPFAMRARMALTASSVVYVIREVSLQNKPTTLIEASPKATVPVLVLSDGQVVDESLDIMHWALGQHYPRQWLPVDEVMNETMANLIAGNDGPFKFHLDRMKYSNRYPGAQPAEHRAAAVKLLETLEEQLCSNAYLFGDTPVLADVAIFPFVRQFAHADAEAFAALPLPQLQDWLTRWEASELFLSVMTKHPVWQPDREHRHG